MEVSIYCNMEKIIYLYAVRETKKKRGIWQWLQDVLCLRYPVRRRECLFLNIPVSAYAIVGPGTEELSVLEKADRPGMAEGVGDGSVARRGGLKRSRHESCKACRYRRTLKTIKKQIQRKEMQTMTNWSDDAFLFFQWKDCMYPASLLLQFYRKCRQENAAVRQAQQLIFLDGWEMSKETDGGEAEMTFMSEIYTTYNYVTIVTERKEAWQEFVQAAYEEYGLSVRCVNDSPDITFREKETLILDMCRREKGCYRSFPGSSVYMDLRESRDKRYRISVKCRGIPYVSLRNALDTALKDTV